MLHPTNEQLIPIVTYKPHYLDLADSTTAVVAISMLGRFFVTFSVNTVMQQTYEIMPTELRAQGVSLSRCLSQFARIFSSYVVFSVRERFQGADLQRKELPFSFTFSGRLKSRDSLLHSWRRWRTFGHVKVRVE